MVKATMEMRIKAVILYQEGNTCTKFNKHGSSNLNPSENMKAAYKAIYYNRQWQAPDHGMPVFGNIKTADCVYFPDLEALFVKHNGQVEAVFGKVYEGNLLWEAGLVSNAVDGEQEYAPGAIALTQIKVFRYNGKRARELARAAKKPDKLKQGLELLLSAANKAPIKREHLPNLALRGCDSDAD